ncbi:MAG: hypothetical protein GX127_09435 [Eubacteriaceae bacterium]|jgi:hypothetical protein|nr:hypothetical protein [Eubacteriaceae bacterium]
MSTKYFETWEEYSERRKDHIHPGEEQYMKEVLQNYDAEMLNFILTLIM